ncbi:hypothetical protein MMYC01_207480 [Madurella mycetomatis]|uniref:DUF4211 domain-containing protein n=1 Tax=Madurella mycetomatis TaxID=100816 RepID=A0A175VYA8_9PEZI|nr:hypothetical protein MMYC01_207480 [Madurella mycetomatis]
MAKHNRAKQQTLEATLACPDAILGRPRVRSVIKTPKPKTKHRPEGETTSSSSPPSHAAAPKSSPRVPPSSFMTSSQIGGSAVKRRVVFEDSSSEESSRGKEPVLPVREANHSEKRRIPGSSSSSRNSTPAIDRDSGSEEDDDDKPLVTPKSGNRLSRKRAIVSDDEDEDGQQSRYSSPIKRRRLVRRNAPSGPATTEKDGDGEASPARARRTRRKPLTAKEKARELLRRKRAGEATEEDGESSQSEEEAPVKAVYDTDSDNPALDEFEDDEEGVLDYEEEKKDKKGKKKKNNRTATGDDDGDGDSDESMDDFLVDDSDAPLGIPAEVYMDIPLQFTSHSHKPLKEHFRDVVEWLVQFKVNPGFSEKSHELYRMAWRKLDDEVRGLAQSKFASSVWKPDFTKALRARPYFTNQELVKGNVDDYQTCGACGRSNHPATWVISFSGTPYYKDSSKDTFLEPVEVGSDSDSNSESCDEDEDGNEIPKETKQWFIGVVCNSNAETAHNLMHWKHALLDWVDTRLHEDGYMSPGKLAERERMRPKQKYKLVDEILKRWVDDGIVKALYQDFKGTIEQARNKSTTGRYHR